jgi:hypothetical protein
LEGGGEIEDASSNNRNYKEKHQQRGKIGNDKACSEVIAEIEDRPNPKENMLPFVYCIIREIDWGDFANNGVPSRQNCSTQ